MATPGKLAVLVSMSLVGVFHAVIAIGVGHAQQGGAIAQTELEAFAMEPGTETVWSKFIERLDGGDSYAIVSAVVMRSEISTSGVMGGVRIELRHEGEKPDCELIYAEWAALCERELATVYIEEARLGEIRQSLQLGSAAVHPGHPAGISSYRSERAGDILSSGLIVFGYSLEGRTTEEFSAALASAVTELEGAPR